LPLGLKNTLLSALLAQPLGRYHISLATFALGILGGRNWQHLRFVCLHAFRKPSRCVSLLLCCSIARPRFSQWSNAFLEIPAARNRSVELGREPAFPAFPPEPVKVAIVGNANASAFPGAVAVRTF
jgi:hypothetical protein